MNTSILFVLLVLYIILTIVVYIKDPTGQVKIYEALYILLSVIGFFIILSLLFLKELNIPRYIDFIFYFFTTILIVGACLGIIMLVMYFLGNPSYTFSGITVVLNFVILITTIALIINSISSLKYFKLENTYFNLIKNIIFFLPCMFIYLIEQIKKEYKITTKTSLIILAFDIIVILLNKYWNKISSLWNNIGGIVLLKDPVYLNKERTIGSFKEIYQKDPQFRYHFAISCDIYINPQPPNTNPSYSKFTSLLNFGNKPNILYKADSNTLKIIVKLNSVNKDDTSVKEILVKNNLLLQRWNNIVINYDGGTMDVFLNKTLLSSHKSVAPLMSFDDLVVGSNDGIHGGIKNVIYFNKSLNLRKILML